eukprot:3887556-Pleurochrysis_carterae.AAC.1
MSVVGAIRMSVVRRACCVCVAFVCTARAERRTATMGALRACALRRGCARRRVDRLFACACACECALVNVHGGSFRGGIAAARAG